MYKVFGHGLTDLTIDAKNGDEALEIARKRNPDYVGFYEFDESELQYHRRADENISARQYWQEDFWFNPYEI